MKEVEQHGIDAGSRRHRKQSTKTGRPSLKSADQSNDIAQVHKGWYVDNPHLCVRKQQSHIGMSFIR
jgi:hypothetical protein